MFWLLFERRFFFKFFYFKRDGHREVFTAGFSGDIFGG